MSENEVLNKYCNVRGNKYVCNLRYYIAKNFSDY
jgi:hypothetical protein